MFEFARATATFAVVLTWAGGAALTLAIVGALTEPMHASAQAVLARLWAWALKALRMALRAFAWVLGLPYGVAVTYFHTYRADAGTGRHFRGFGYRNQGAGRHRRQAWA